MRQTTKKHYIQKKKHCQSIRDQEQRKLATGARFVEDAINSGAVVSDDEKKKSTGENKENADGGGAAV